MSPSCSSGVELDQAQVRQHGNIVVFNPRHFAVFADDDDRSAGDAFFRKIHAILFRHGAARLKIREQGIVDAHFFCVGFVRPNAVYADAQDFGVQSFK